MRAGWRSGGTAREGAGDVEIGFALQSRWPVIMGRTRGDVFAYSPWIIQLRYCPRPPSDERRDARGRLVKSRAFSRRIPRSALERADNEEGCEEKYDLARVHNTVRERTVARNKGSRGLSSGRCWRIGLSRRVIKGGGDDNCDRDLNARHFGSRGFREKLDLLWYTRFCTLPSSIIASTDDRSRFSSILYSSIAFGLSSIVASVKPRKRWKMHVLSRSTCLNEER